MNRSNRLLIAAGLVWLVLLSSCSKSNFRPPEREGPPALVQQEKESRLWLLLKREEQRMRYLGGGGRLIGKWITETYYHFDLQSHDPANADRLWKKRVLTVEDDAGGRVAQARLLGQEGDVVWTFMNDGPVALSAKDGSALADRCMIEERNPELRGLIPKDLDFYAYDGGLVIVTADARRFRIRTPKAAAEPYTPPNEDHFRNVQFMATRWNGGYHAKDFVVNQIMLEGRWLGLFSEKEATQAGNDEWGDHMKKPETIYLEGSRARRTFWSARIGKTKEFTEGTHDRLFDVTRIPGAPEYLEAGLLIKQGTKTPLRLQNPDGFLVLYKTRIDEEGRLALTRLDDHLKARWTATLPFHDLHNRYESPGHLLLYGMVRQTEKGVTGSSEHLVALNLADGKMQSWNVPAEKRVD
ncbi:MAG: hypothetical protein H0T83_05325 [Chthoniobacterales bacterium]|nr:hypothetical protein [Chthoniobacterales bacterium]